MCTYIYIHDYIILYIYYIDYIYIIILYYIILYYTILYYIILYYIILYIYHTCIYIYIYVLYIHTITYNYIYMHHAHTHIPCWKNNTYISPFPNRSLGSWNCSHRSWCTVYITMRMSISEHNYLHMEWKWCVYKTMMMIYIYICIPKKIMLG